MTNELTFFSSLTDKEPKLVSWEHVAALVRSDQLQKLCSDYRALLPLYRQAADNGDKERERQLKAQLSHIKQQLPAINVNRISGLACDPCAYFRPFPKALKIKQHKHAEQKRGKRPACEKAGAIARQLVDGEGIAFEEGNRNNYVSRVIYWMNRFGIDAEKTRKWAEVEFSDYDAANGHPIAGIVRAVFGKHSDEHNTCRPSAFAATGDSRPRKSTIMEVEAFLTSRYCFRRNLLSQQVEYSMINQNENIKELKDESSSAQLSKLQPSTSNMLTDAVENSLWIDSNEIAELNDRNRAYETPNLARELISTRYRKPLADEKVVYLTASDIVARFGGQVRLSAVQVGKALQDMGIEQQRTHHGRFWKLFERPAADIGHVVPDGVEQPRHDLPF